MVDRGAFAKFKFFHPDLGSTVVGCSGYIVALSRPLLVLVPEFSRFRDSRKSVDFKQIRHCHVGRISSVLEILSRDRVSNFS